MTTGAWASRLSGRAAAGHPDLDRMPPALRFSRGLRHGRSGSPLLLPQPATNADAARRAQSQTCAGSARQLRTPRGLSGPGRCTRLGIRLREGSADVATGFMVLAG
ncbi:hypothetical protein QJS66_10550 [Kocuria rhizophila]|nr:hypothetical protein QJS66_10550 [Kocuria rhizophila]